MQLRIVVLQLGRQLQWSPLLEYLNAQHVILTVRDSLYTSFPNIEAELVLKSYERTLETVLRFKPDVIITLGGPHGDTCIPGGPFKTYLNDALYCGDVITVWNNTQCPLLYVCNSPLHLPRSSDMNRGPDIILSQTQRHGCLYAATQTWQLNDEDTDPENLGIPVRSAVIAWAHSGLPGSPPDPLDSWGPIFPLWEGWVSPGLAQGGLVPRVYDAGGYLVYDPDFLCVPADSTLRWNPSKPLVAISERDQQLAKSFARPDFTFLEQTLERI